MDMIIDDNGVVFSGSYEEMMEIMYIIEQGLEDEDKRTENLDWEGDLVHVKEISRTR